MPTSLDDRYISLLKRTLTRYEMDDRRYTVEGGRHPARVIARGVKRLAAVFDYDLVARKAEDFSRRIEGRDQPVTAETMIGLKRLENIETCVRAVVADRIPGDFIETGVWRGGACIFMRALLEVLDEPDRRVFVADSFQGLPKPTGRYAQDKGDYHHQLTQLAVSRKDVEKNFERYGLLDDRVVFLEGWFKDTIPTAPIEQLAILRLDGDMYESTRDALDPLYDKVPPGGFVIVDDYALDGCRKAIDDFREEQGITDPIERIDWTGVFWRKS